MELSKYFVLIAVSIFLFFIKNSTASPLIEAIDPRYQADLDDFDKKASIGGASNIVIQLGQAAIKKIEDIAAFYKAAGAHPEAVDVLLDGLILTIKLIAESGDDAFDLIDKYNGNDKHFNDPEEAISDINSGLRKIKDEIFHAGVPVLHAMGAAGVIAPGVSKPKIKKSLDPLQDSGTAIFDGIDAAESLATHGLKSNKRSRSQSIKAAHNAILAGCNALNQDFVRATKRVMAYLADVANGKVQEVDATGDAISARAKAVVRDAETLAVIEDIDLNILKALMEGVSGKILSAIREGILGDIESSAMGIGSALKGIKDASDLIHTDPKKAISIANEGFDAARQGCIDGSVQGYQAFGAAGHLLGQKKVFSQAIEDIENSRIDGTGGIEATRKLTNMALIAGGDALESGLAAAVDALEAVEIELYTRIANAEKVALEILKAVTKHPGLI
ncbi:uncharacterized protein LOC129915478 [Episyrphus balteatus]|uniref:uncharacterized protein LOC129915478 n=1 Tax=Episyrphus balteatus TaxID=286459 RepID=UPI0024850467|nr:uncharacterized protein LOC129915478 [Episyrphus balteatus]